MCEGGGSDADLQFYKCACLGAGWLVGRAGGGLSQLLRALRLYNRRPRIKKNDSVIKGEEGGENEGRSVVLKRKGKRIPYSRI